MWRPEFIPFLRSRRISLNIDLSLAALLRRSSNIHRRRERRAYNEVLSTETRAKRPSYYLQNFHFQSGGWMTDDSAERYDTQVEVLLNGAANAIRRQALPQLHEAFAGRDQRKLRLLDIGCGTGRFLDFVKQTWPRLQTIGLDMSQTYLKHAQRHLKRWTRTGLVAGKAEAIPLPDNSQDAVTNTFLFHELPPKVRRITIRECARVLKPGRPFGNPRFTPTRRSSRLRRALRALPAELSRAVLLELHY